MTAATKIELKTREVFEKGTLNTKDGKPVPARVFLDTIGALSALLKTANGDGPDKQEALYILGHLSSVGSNEFVFSNLESHTGTYYYSITRGGRIIDVAREIIQDVLKDDPSLENTGPEFSIQADHYLDQLNQKAETGFHFEISEEFGVPKQVADLWKGSEVSEQDKRTGEWIRQARIANAAKPGNN